MVEENYISIPQAAEKWPDSKGNTFQLQSQSPNVYYFRIDEPEFLNFRGIRSRVKCVKFNKEDGYLVITNVLISNDEVIKSLTIKDFVDVVTETLIKLLTDPITNAKKLIPYENLGFLENRKSPGAKKEA